MIAVVFMLVLTLAVLGFFAFLGIAAVKVLK